VLTAYNTGFKVKISAFYQHKLFVILQKTTVVSLHMLNGLPATGASCSAEGKNTPNFFFLKRFIRQTVYARCKRMNCKIVPVTNSNRYVQYGASGKGVVEIHVNNSSEKGTEKKLRSPNFYLQLLFIYTPMIQLGGRSYIRFSFSLVSLGNL